MSARQSWLMKCEPSAYTIDDLKRDGNGGSTDNVLTYGMGYNQNRYSTLKQINKRNVKRLVPVWSASLQNLLGEQAQPLVYNGVMYVTNAAWTFAIDVATGKQTHQIIFKRNKKHSCSRITLSSASSAQLPVHTTALMPFGTYYCKPTSYFYICSKLNICTPTRHIGCNSDATSHTRFSYNLGFTSMLFCVQNIVCDTGAS